MSRPTLLVGLLALLAGLLGLAACGEDPPPTRRAVLKYGVPADDLGGSVAGGPIAAADKPVPVAGGPGPEAGGPTVVQAPPAGGGPRPKPGKYKAVEVKDGGRITGICRIAKAVDVAKVPIGRDTEKCGHGAEMASERIQFDPATRALRWCVVYLADVTEGKDWAGDMAAAKPTAILDQKGCVYLPHVQVVRAGTQLVVLNSDPVEHNLHAYKNTELVTQFNFGTPPGARSDSVPEALLKSAAKYIVKCDIHPWMNATVHATVHPYYAVTGEDGRFVLENVPPGTWTLVCWHEGMTATAVVKDGAIAGYNYGKDVEVSAKVTVTAGGETTHDFEVPAP